MRRGFLNLADLGDFTAAAVENDTISFIASYMNGRVFTCNLAFCRLTGYSKEEVSERKWPEDFAAAECRARAMEIVRGISCDVAPYTYELEFVRKDGSTVPVDIFVHKFCNDAGTVLYYYSFIADMTEHKRLENALRKSEAKYRELVENANSIILKMDTRGNVTFFNEFAQHFFKFEPDEILDKNVIGTIVPFKESSGRDLSKMIKDVCVHPERYVNNENENMRSNGERVWVSWTNKAITDDRHNLVGILCVGNDITALKNADMELKRSRDELEIRVKERTIELEKVNTFLLNEIEARKHAEKGIVESEAKFRTLAETSPVAIFFHRGVSFIYANPAAEKILGRSFQEIEKLNFWELFAPEFQQLIKERGLARLRGENPTPRYEVRLQAETGEKWLEITSKRVMYKGNPAILTIGLDVTQYKQAVTALSDSKIEAELYVDLMSHDINNINQIGIGNLELLMESVTLNALEKERLSRAVLAFKNSSQLIDNVKKLRKAKKCEFDVKKMDIGPLLDRVKKYYLAVPDRNVTINLEPRTGCYVVADEMLYDVFANIVENSIKHSKGSVEINVRLDRIAMDNKDCYRVVFEDNGPGIKPDLQKRVFDRMYYEGGIMRGKGLGLYLVKVLVECFHGSVFVEDRVQGDRSKGARFVVMLPAVDS